jgi:hypothetical protein
MKITFYRVSSETNHNRKYSACVAFLEDEKIAYNITDDRTKVHSWSGDLYDPVTGFVVQVISKSGLTKYAFNRMELARILEEFREK